MRVIALFEAAKGGLVLLAGCGALALVHRDIQAMAEALVERSHFNPASRYPRIFVHAASGLTDARLWLFAVGAAGYAAVRFVEAYGLWRHRRWAEWFAAVSGGIYIPIEAYALLDGVTWPKLAAMFTNAAMVAYMARALLQRRLSDRKSVSRG